MRRLLVTLALGAALLGGAARADEPLFRVYFTNEDTTLTPEAMQLIASYSSEIAAASRVILTAHGDPQESNPAHIAAERGAEVAHFLADYVANGAEVSIVNKSDQAPAVPTSPGKSNPRNRFVAVELR